MALMTSTAAITPIADYRASHRGRLIADRRFLLTLWQLAWPIALQNFLTYSVGLADNLMIGVLGEVALSAIFLVNQITNLLQMLTTGMSAALLILSSQYWGRRQSEPVRQLVAVCMRMSLAVTIVLLLLAELNPRLLLRCFTDESTVIEAAVPFLRIVAAGYPLFVLSGVLITAMRVIGQVKLGMVVSVLALLTNLGLDFVLINGYLGFPALGITGSAIGTLLAYILEFGIVAAYALTKDRILRLRPGILRQFNVKLSRDFIRYGSPIVLGDVLWGVNLAVQGAIVGRLGVAAIAAVTISNNLFQLFSVLCYGMRDASSMLVGQAVGQGDSTALKRLTRTLQLIFLAVGLVTGGLMFSLRRPVLSLYQTLDAATIRLCLQFLSILSVTVIGTAYQMSALTGIVRAGGATRFVLINDLIFVWLWVLPSSALAAFVFKAPPTVVFALLKSDQILKCLVAVVKTNRYTWVHRLTRD
ncbi:MATE family efflux transporter [Oscillospiraceae bacterium HV4-5-C5C]|nr:MATE family efflux transporter [Oscillospiraceae bacterium HV4-5-C5C]